MTRRTPTQYNWPTLEFDETILTKHITAPRRERIQFVVIHHMTVPGKDTATNALDACYNIWQTRVASAHYGVQGAQVRQYVWDSNAAWATANVHGNHAGISIEHTNLTLGPAWEVSNKTWKTGAKLAAHLHLVYRLGRPVKGKTVRRHLDFFPTGCPGPFLGDVVYDAYVKEAQRVYDEISKTKPPVKTPVKPPVGKPSVPFKVTTYNGAGYDSVRGEDNAVTRTRTRLVPNIRKDSPDALAVQEWSAVGEPDMVSETDRLLTSSAREAIAKGTGVYRKKSTTNHVASGVLQLAPKFAGNDKQCAWAVTSKNGVRALTASLHLTSVDDDDKDSKGLTGLEARLRQTRSAFKQLLAIAKEHDVDVRNIQVAGDFNSWSAVLAVAAEFGFVDSLDLAKTKVGGEHDSFNGWKKTPTKGRHLDHVLVHKTATVTQWALLVDEDASDHNRITVTVALAA